jgi:hypothetical protein
MSIDEILEKANLKYEDLNAVEKETLHSWMQNLNKAELTIDSVRTYIAKMKAGVEADLTKTDLNSKQDMFLKARLRNYILMEAFLESPKKAKEALESAIMGIKLDRQ